MTSSGDPPTLSVDGHRAMVQLNRPAVMNRIEPDDLAVLAGLFKRVESDRHLRVLVLTGTGRVFSSGFDLRAVGRSDTPDEPSRTSFEALVDQLETLSVPTICRLNGGVYGGATDLALACDFRIGVLTTEMFMPAARLGLHYYRSGMVRYVSRLGIAAAKRLFLTAQKLDATELLRIGYLDAAVPADDLDARIDALAAMLAANAPGAVAAMKRSLNEISRGVHDAEKIDARHQASLHGDEIKEGAAAFREKRAPRFD